MKKIFIYSFFFLAFLERVWFDLGPNIEIITLATILSAFYLDKKTTVLLSLFTVAFTDLLIGNSSIFMFTWSGIVLPILVVDIFKRIKMSKIISGTLAGISNNLFFFFWTNFGVWALDSWGMYPNTITGLLQSYINGFPFLKYQLTSTLFFVPIGIFAFEAIFNRLLKGVKRPSAQFILSKMNG